MNSPPEDDADLHVGDRILDYCAGALDASQRRDVDRHLATCEPCRADYAWTTSLQADVIAGDLRHLAAERLLALAESDTGAGTLAEQRHLASCRECRQAQGWARDLPALPELPDRWTDLVARAKGALQEAVAATARLARIEPIQVRLHRGATAPGSFDELWSRALEQYSAGEFAAAEQEFERAEERAGGKPEVSLYLGSTRLLAGRTSEAIAALRVAVERAGPLGEAASRVRLAEESRWQLANALLASGDAGAASELLAEVTAAAGLRGAAAEELLRRIASARDPA